MRSPVYCDKCQDVQVGWHYTYPETFTGQDPPETELFDEAVEDDGYVYCEYCWEIVEGFKWGDEEEEE